MTKHLLIGLFSVIFLVMLGTTIYASFDRSVFAVGEQLLADPWFQATLVDAYLGFLTFYVWGCLQGSVALDPRILVGGDHVSGQYGHVGVCPAPTATLGQQTRPRVTAVKEASTNVARVSSKAIE